MSRPVRQKAIQLLKDRDFESLMEWARTSRSSIRALNSLAFNTDELIRWRAIEAIGKIASIRKEKDLAGVRDMIRRLLWSMTDESGATAWYAPETIGEILANVPDLVPEFGRLLAAYFHEEPFERGAYWATARAAAVAPKPFHEIKDALIRSLDAADPFIRAFSFLALHAAGLQEEISKEKMDLLERDTEPIRFYDSDQGILRDSTVSRTVTEAGL